MEHITVKDILKVTNGKLLCGNKNTVIEDMSTNSAVGNEHTLFVPLKGERTDGHKYIENALERCGATLTMQHDKMYDKKPWIKVENTMEALQQIGKWYRKKCGFPIVGVTGSVGKTTTREMIYTALACQKNVFQTEKNYNSQVGVPLTLAKLKPENEIAVLEMGMSNPGEMVRLADMVRPDVAVMTCIGVAHIEQLKTKEKICKEKLEITHYMNDDGVLFLNGDDEILRKYASEVSVRKIWYGMGENCEYRAENIEIRDGRTQFICKYPNGECKVCLEALGEHNVRNALAALAVADYFRLDVEKAARSLLHFQGQRQRVVKTAKCTLIDDTYNASPDSMKASLGVLKEMPCKGRRIAVLADMLELGEKTIFYHQQVGNEVVQNEIDCLYTYGELSKEIGYQALKKNSALITKHFDSRERLCSFLQEEIVPEDVLLFKGSNGMKLKEIVEKIEK